jgi:single-strand DNA-binding protein|nr:MAG TPA: Single strand binding protein [Caudoviricetes sp.]
MNVFSATGNLGKDCRKGNAGNTAVLNFSIGVKSGFGDKEQTLWLDCAIFGKQAESKLGDYLVKGQQVAVSGELGTREHESKTYLTLKVNSIDLVGGKKDGNSSPAQQQSRPQQSQQAAPPDDFGSDIPFAPAHYLTGI